MTERPPRSRGTFVAVVGPSGAGKDSVIRFAADALGDRADIVFARRVVTREADRASEDHDTMTPEAFKATAKAGSFALAWQAHGLHYGVPVDTLQAIEDGKVVVANLSRHAIRDAAECFKSVVVVQVTADPETLRTRLANRGRESDPDAIASRVARDVALDPCGCRLVEIDNSGALADAGTRFRLLLEELVP